MLIRIGLENNDMGRSMAWALDFPGAFAYGQDGSEALLNLPRGLIQYQEWANRHAGENWIKYRDFDLRLVETWQVYRIDRTMEESTEGYEVEAWFRNDWRPLQAEEIERSIKLFEWSRADLLTITAELPAEKLDAEMPGERWSIRGILSHIGGAEWWYLDRLGLAQPRTDLPKDAFARLAATRGLLLEVLPGLAGSKQVVGVDGEFWSPRKLLRRAHWHELDHIGHIIQLL
jgi:hypothetical protein